MNYRTKRTAVLMFTFLNLTLQPSMGQKLIQEAVKTPQNAIAILPYYHPPSGCNPAEVKIVSSGPQPRGSVIPQVTIQNFSPQPITAVKLGWNVYRSSVANRKVLSRCDVEPEEGEVFLSGATPLIQIGQLAEKETCNIGADPLMILTPPATRTVLVDRAIVSSDELKPLRAEGTGYAFRDDYAIVVYVSEIRFIDGTEWKGAIK